MVHTATIHAQPVPHLLLLLLLLVPVSTATNKSWVVELQAGAADLLGYAGNPSAAALTDGTASKANGSYVVAYEAASKHGSMCLGDAYIALALLNPDGTILHTYKVEQPAALAGVAGVPFAPVVHPNTQLPGSVFDVYYTVSTTAATAAHGGGHRPQCPLTGTVPQARYGAVIGQRFTIRDGRIAPETGPLADATLLGKTGPGLKYVTRGNVYPVQPSPEHVTHWGLPLASIFATPPAPARATDAGAGAGAGAADADADADAAAAADGEGLADCQAAVLISNHVQLELAAAAFHRSGCLAGRYNITLGAPHVVQGYTCAAYTVPTMLFESNDDRLWLSTPINDGQRTWNTAVPTGIPSLPNSSFSTINIARLNQSATPTMVVTLNPPDGDDVLLAIAGKGFADLSALVEVEGPDSPFPPTPMGAHFIEPSMVELPTKAVTSAAADVRVVYVVVGSNGTRLGIRVATIAPPR